jgi:hypothetical protein
MELELTDSNGGVQSAESSAYADLTERQLRDFGVVMAAVIMLGFGIVIPWAFSRAIPKWPWVIGAAFLVLGILYPQFLSVVCRLWLKMGALIAVANVRVLLTFVFFLVLSPVGILLKVFGRKDPLNLRYSDQESYRLVRPVKKRPKHMNNPF